MIDSKTLNRPLNPLWRKNTNSTELLVIVLHLWDRGSRDVEETLFIASVHSYMYVCIWSGNKEIVSCIESSLHDYHILYNMMCLMYCKNLAV